MFILYVKHILAQHRYLSRNNAEICWEKQKQIGAHLKTIQKFKKAVGKTKYYKI